MIKPPPKNWTYILIELEVDDCVVDSRIASYSTYNNLYSYLLTEGQTQQLPWALYISKWQYRKENTNVIKRNLIESVDK